MKRFILTKTKGSLFLEIFRRRAGANDPLSWLEHARIIPTQTTKLQDYNLRKQILPNVLIVSNKLLNGSKKVWILSAFIII